MELPDYHPFVSAEAKTEYLEMYDAKATKWPVPSEPILVETSFGQTLVRISGPAGAPPLVLLHGLGGNSLSWTPFIKAWSQDFRTYAVDNVYYSGRSVYSREIEGPDDYVEWLDGLFRALGLDRGVSLVGMSYGGWIAGEYAVCRPSRLRKVVLIAPAATVLPLSEEVTERMMKSFSGSPMDFLAWMMEDYLAVTGEAGQKYFEATIAESALAGRCYHFKPVPAPTVLADEELEYLKVPLLFLVGEHEKNYMAGEAIARLKGVAPQVETELIPGAGHDLLLLQGELVSGKVLEFLKEL